jgi:hypothetical protein
MYASRPVLYTLAAILTFFTSYIVIPMERPTQQTSSNLEERVSVLEEQVADLSSRIAVLENQTISSTATAVADTEPPVQVAVPDDDAEEGAPVPSNDYQPVLAQVNPLGCKYDAFQDWEVCSRLETQDFDRPMNSWGMVNGNLVLIESLLVQPTDEQPEVRWAITYVGDDWIFLDRIIFLFDGKRHVVTFDPLQQRFTDVLEGGSVAESVEVPVDSIADLIDIVTSQNVQVRLSGSDGNVDKDLTDYEKEIFLRTLATYEQRGGQLPENRLKLENLLPQTEEFNSTSTPSVNKVVPSPEARLTGTTDVANANLRSGPGTDYDVTSQVRQGDVLEIVGVSQDGNWYELDNGSWIAVSLVNIESSTEEAQPRTPAASPQIVSRYPSSAVSITPYDQPVNLGSSVHWYGCASTAPPDTFPFEIQGAAKLFVDMITYSDSGYDDQLNMRLNAADGELIGVVYEGPAFSGRQSATIDLPPGVQDFTFWVEAGGCWTARLTAQP